MKTLYLPLKKEWYEMIERGEKTEEYREIKPYWIKRLCDNPVFDSKGNLIGRKPIDDWTIAECRRRSIDLIRAFHRGNMIPKELTHARFRRGYTHTAMLFRIDSITIGRGKSEWGAPDHGVFIIKLGNKLQ